MTTTKIHPDSPTEQDQRLDLIWEIAHTPDGEPIPTIYAVSKPTADEAMAFARDHLDGGTLWPVVRSMMTALRLSGMKEGEDLHFQKGVEREPYRVYFERVEDGFLQDWGKVATLRMEHGDPFWVNCIEAGECLFHYQHGARDYSQLHSRFALHPWVALRPLVETLYPGITYDAAIPQNLFDRLAEGGTFDPRFQYVYLYPKQLICGVLAPLSREAKAQADKLGVMHACHAEVGKLAPEDSLPFTH